MHGDESAPRRTDIAINWAKGFLVALLFVLLDPIGCSERADRLAERVVLAVSAPFLSSPAHDRDGQRRITVVVVDDAFMAAYRAANAAPDASWPISRQDQFFTIIEPILNHRPAALLLDWVYHQEGEGADSAGALAREISGMIAMDPRLAATRIILSDRPPHALADQRIGCPFRLTTVARIAEGGHMAASIGRIFQPDAGVAAEDHWAERAAIRHWGREERYPLAPLALVPTEDDAHRAPDDDCPPFTAEQPLIPSAALAMFSHWCSLEGSRLGHALCNPRAGQPVLAANGASLGYRQHRWPPGAQTALATASVPQWLWFQSETMRAIRRNIADAGGGRHPCLDVDAGGRWAGVLSALRPRMGISEESVPYNPCIAIDTISATDLQAFGEGLSDAALEALLKDRLVLVGADVDAAPDRAASPVNGTLPAVLVHATVLENLISDGAGRARESGVAWGGIGWGVLASILLASLTAIPMGMLGHRIAAAGPRPAGIWPRLLVLAALGLGLVLPLLLGVLLFWATNWAPANWISPLAAKFVMLGGATAAARFALPGLFQRLERAADAMSGVLGRAIEDPRRARSRMARALLVLALMLAALATAYLLSQ